MNIEEIISSLEEQGIDLTQIINLIGGQSGKDMSKYEIANRIQQRKPSSVVFNSTDQYGNNTYNPVILGYIEDIQKRVMLRLYPYTPEKFPRDLNYIVSDVAIALLNRAEADHEGIETEKVDTFSVTFIDDALSPYLDDIALYKKTLEDKEPPDEHKGAIRFL